MQARGHRQQRSTRSIELVWDTGPDGARRLTAECDDEITTMLLIGRPIFDESDPAALLAGEVGAMAVAGHLERCEACHRWQVAA